MIVGEVCYEDGVRPWIVFTVTPQAIHASNECTACVVKTLAPDGTPATYTSPNAALASTTYLTVIDGVTTKITEWTFTFPAGLGGSKRHPWFVHFEGTAGVLTVLTTSHSVAPSVFA